MPQQLEHTRNACPPLSHIEIIDENKNQINVFPRESVFCLYKNICVYFAIYTCDVVMSVHAVLTFD